MRVLPAEASALVDAPPADVVLVDARRELAGARSLCRLLRTTGLSSPLVLVLTEGGLAGITARLGRRRRRCSSTAGPAEVEARLRLAVGRAAGRRARTPTAAEIRAGDVVIDEATYSARVRGRLLDLTYKEFELLKYLAQHPGRVFTRAQLLQEVWGYDYYGGTRTVDVHVRRLRAKLGPEHEVLIGTVRNVGYRFVPEAVTRRQRTDPCLTSDLPPSPPRPPESASEASPLPGMSLSGTGAPAAPPCASGTPYDERPGSAREKRIRACCRAGRRDHGAW